MITTVEGQTVWTLIEPTLQQVLSGDYTLPVNFKVVDTTTSTYKLVSFVTDSVNGARRLELGGGQINEKIPIPTYVQGETINKDDLRYYEYEDVNGVITKGIWRSEIDDNTDLPGTTSTWKLLADISGEETGNYIPLSGTEEGKSSKGRVKMVNDSGIMLDFWRTDDEEGNPEGNFSCGKIEGLGSSVGYVAGTDGDKTIFTNKAISFFTLDEYKTLNIPVENGTLLTDKGISYSTEETLTGGTWIDGKPIYRKVIPFFDMSSYTTEIDMSSHLSNIDTVITNNFMWDLTTGVKANSSQLDNTNYLLYRVDLNSIIVQNSTGYIVNLDAFDSLIFTIEYTKTTDT